MSGEVFLCSHCGNVFDVFAMGGYQAYAAKRKCEQSHNDEPVVRPTLTESEKAHLMGIVGYSPEYRKRYG